MKKLFTLLALVTALALNSSAQTLESADKNFEAAKYQTAYDEYIQLVNNADQATALKAQIRSADSLSRLYQYENAVKQIYSYPLPQDSLWKARFLLFRTFLSIEVTNRYGYKMPTDEEVTETEDLSKLTKNQWLAKISEDYKTLWNMRKELAAFPLKDESLLLNLKDADFNQIPTVLDFTILRIEKFVQLQNRNSGISPLRADDIVAKNYNAKNPSEWNYQSLADVYQEGYNIEGNERESARGFWYVKRITLPFNNSAYFEFTDRQKSSLEASNILTDFSGYTQGAAKKSLWSKIKSVFSSSSVKATEVAKAYAAQEAAGLLINGTEEDNDYKRAHDICTYAINNLGDNEYTFNCKATIKNIERKELNIGSTPVTPNPQDIKATLVLRNIPTVYGVILKTTQDELKSFDTRDSYNYSNPYDYLRRIDTYNENKNAERILAQKPYKSFEQSYTYPKEYGVLENAEIKIPALEKGLYIVAISYDKELNSKQAPVMLAVLNVSDLMITATQLIEDKPENFVLTPKETSKSLKSKIFKIYALNPLTGLPVEDAEIALSKYKNAYEKKEYENSSLKTNADGIADFSSYLHLNLSRGDYFNTDMLAKKGTDLAYLNSAIYFSNYSDGLFNMYVQTDRSIYRPGQEVSFKVNAFEKLTRGLKAYDRPYEVKITVRNNNGNKAFYEKSLKFNEFGSASGKFTLPTDETLGNYSISASVSDRAQNFSTNQSFRVEEYKRPEFEVTFKDASAPWQYGKEVKVEGNAKYYFGSPVTDAKVEYRVYRQDYLPPFCWWWRMIIRSKRVEILHGNITTDSKGDFNFKFKPEQDDNKYASMPSRYIVEANVIDAGGRTIKGDKNYLASKDNGLFKIELTQGFADADKAYELEVSLVDINENLLAGNADIEVYKLDDSYADPKDNNSIYKEMPVSDNGRDDVLTTAFADTKESEKVYATQIALSKSASTTLSIPALGEGVYRIKFKQSGHVNKDSQGADVVFVSAADGRTLNLPAIALPQYKKYYPGETAKILVGSDKIKNVKFLEISQGKFLLKADRINNGGVSVYELPVMEEHRGNVGLGWFGVSDYNQHKANATLTVPFDNKELKVKFTAPDSVKPGEKLSWIYEVLDNKGNPVNAETLIKIYDRSLDYYAKAYDNLTLGNLYPSNSTYVNASSSLFNAQYSYHYVDNYVPEPQYENKVYLPHFYTEYQYRYMRSGGIKSKMLGGVGAVMYAEADDYAMAAPMANSSMARSTTAVAKQSVMMDEAEAKPEAATGGMEDGGLAGVEVRTDMSETALFDPHNKVTGGKGTISFTMPERLTSWSIMLKALTKDVKTGTLNAQTVTKKDFMLRLEMPRFFREKDNGQIKAVINNETNKDVSANVILYVKEDGVNAYEALSFTDTRKTVTVKANSQAQVVWDVKVQPGVRVLTLTASARGGGMSDAEEKTLPILPSRERLVDSKVIALTEGNNKIVLDDLKKPDVTREVDVVTLQIDPNLLLPVLNSLPMLVEYPYESLSSLTTKYVPLAIVNSFYNKYPELKKAVANLPKRDTITPAWEKDNSLRQLMLTETPWIREAEGTKVSYGKMIDLFDTKKVSSLEKETIAKIEKYQLSSGAFTWMKGGTADDYMTLYVLNGFAEAAAHGVAVPEASAKKAMKYMTGQIDREIKKAKDEYQVILSLYAAYVLTSFPADWAETKDALKKAEAWIDYADSYKEFMTPLGKIYAANIYHRMGNKEKADFYLDSVLDALKVDPVTGAYFTPEEKSWLWYRDTLETHSITMRTLMRLRPEDKKIDYMAKWLLFNRKGNSWRSTKASASAIYALLEVMKAKGAFTTDSIYTVAWGTVKDSQTFKPFDFVKKPLRYTKEKELATSAYFEANINKKGKTIDFASLSAVYSTDAKVEESSKGTLNVSKEYFLRQKSGDTYKLIPVADNATVNVGDEIVVNLTVTTSSQFEYVLIKDPRPAGFEGDTLLSDWKWDSFARYEEPRDSLTNFFMNYLPHGKYTLSYTIRPTTPGTYKAGATVIQSMFAPEFAAHSANMTINVK
ncbi:YfaS (alpha-2-macroglobulin family) [Elusimicrobium posterum]|uniref:alpha-2-macroglobulin family protein n=1 Tax=Elusimicrobium posterum TaxID=3116653 RepID=UPI003C78A046